MPNLTFNCLGLLFLHFSVFPFNKARVRVRLNFYLAGSVFLLYRESTLALSMQAFLNLKFG